MKLTELTDERKGFSRTIKTFTNVKNDPFAPGDCHGSNNSMLSKSGIV
jgi:hypothetical protein